MNPERIVFNDNPAFIAVPEAFQHRKVEVILWPLDDEHAPKITSASTWPEFFNQFSRQIDDATSCARDELYAEQIKF